MADARIPLALGIGGVATIFIVSGLQGKGILNVVKGDFTVPGGSLVSATDQSTGDTASVSSGAVPDGTSLFDGHPVCNWIITILQWARRNGWEGQVTSGYRTKSEQLAAAANYARQKGQSESSIYPNGPLGSNHTKTKFPGCAVDVTQPDKLASVLKSYPGIPTLHWGGNTIEDAVHFSYTGH